jgi:lysozyme
MGNTSRKITARGITLVKEFEGFSSTPYVCAAGYPTIGYGHLIKAGEHYSAITMIEAETLLLQDIAASEQAVLRLISVPLTSGQFDAITSFTFNLGAASLQRSSLRIYVNRNQHDDAAKEFMR